MSSNSFYENFEGLVADLREIVALLPPGEVGLTDQLVAEFSEVFEQDSFLPTNDLGRVLILVSRVQLARLNSLVSQGIHAKEDVEPAVRLAADTGLVGASMLNDHGLATVT